jgi:hypothetical protein
MSLKPRGRALARRNAPLLLLLLALPLSLLTQCSESSPAPASEATQCGVDSDCGTRKPECDGSNVASFTPHCRYGTCAWDKAETPCAGGCLNGACQAEGPPSGACSVATDCELPRSTCTGTTVVYYTNASCNSGVCSYEQATMACFSGCSNGGCTTTTTTTSGPPPGGSSGGGQSGASGSGAPGGAGGNGGESSGGAGAGG